MALFRSPWLHGAVIVLLGFIIYSGVLKNEFVYDDFTYIVENYQIRSFRHFPQIFSSSYPPSSEQRGLYRPITTLYYMLDYALWGLNSHKFHITNIIAYLITCVLFWLFIRQLTGNKYLSLIVALIFTVHPVHTENVNWAVGRTAILSMLFLLVALITYLFWRRLERPGLGLIGIICLAYLLALGSYESAITLPLIILLIDFIQPATGTTFLKRVKRNLLSIYVPLIVVTILYVGIRFLVLGRLGPVKEETILKDIGLIQRLALVPIIYLKNSLLLLFPFKLTIVYKPTFEELFTLPLLLLGLVSLIAIAYVSLYLRTKHPFFSFGLLFILITLLPVSNIIPIGIVISERTLFLPSIGFCLAVGALLWLLLNPQKLLWQTERNIYFLGLLLIIIVFYGARTIARGKEWRNPYTLWTAELSYYPGLPEAHNNLGLYLYRQGNVGLAEQHLKKSIELKEDYHLPHLNLAKLYIEQGKRQEALDILNKALALKPDSFGSNYTAIGALYLDLGLANEAEKAFQQSLEVNPENGDALSELATIELGRDNYKTAEELYNRALATDLAENTASVLNNRAVLYDKMGETDKAEKDLKRALKLRPELSLPYLKLAEIYCRQGKAHLAIELLRTGIRKAQPPNLALNLYLAQIYERLGLLNEALRILEQCRQVAPADPRSYLIVGEMLSRAGRYEQAQAIYQQAITVAPGYPASYERMGDLFSTIGRDKEARQYWQQALELDPKNKQLQQKLTKPKSP